MAYFRLWARVPGSTRKGETMPKRIGKAVFVAIIFYLSLGYTIIQAEETKKPAASADIALLTQYVWRGFGLSDDSLVIQPAATVEYYGVSLNLWSNLDTDYYAATSDQGNFQLTETDVTLAYCRDFGPLSTGVGYIYYGLDAAADSQEIYISLGMNVLFSPGFTVYREMAYYPGWYFNLGVAHSIELTKSGIALDISGAIGYLDADGAGGYLCDGLISLGLTLPVSDYFSLGPMIYYSVHLSEKAYDAIEAGSADGGANHVYGGATLSFEF